MATEEPELEIPAEEKPAQPQTPFLQSLRETADMIDELRAELSEVQRQRRELELRENSLTVRIAALNALRQAHELPPR